jgi:uncharacterized protein (TIGR02284 family)
MLRDERQTLINALLEACEEAVSDYRDEAAEAKEPALAGLLRQLAAEREVTVMELSGAIRALGDMPDIPDADRVQLSQLVTRVRARFSPRHDGVLADAGVERERHIAALARSAAPMVVQPDLRSLLESTAESAEAARARLARFAAG